VEADPCGSREPCIRWGQDPLMGSGIFEGGHVPANGNLPTHGKCACPAHALEESIRRREG